MPQSRGMVKIVPKDNSGNDLSIEDAIGGAVDWVVDYIPFFVDFYNTVTGSTNEYTDRQIIDTYQNFWTYVFNSGYMFYVEDFQLTYHGKDTETFQTGTGTQQGVQTNEESYREFAFKTTISERDYDIVSGMWTKTAQNIHNFSGANSLDVSLADWISGAAQDIWNSATGYSIAWTYLDKRQQFLTDLDGKDLRISSSMFKAADVKMTKYSYLVPSGQQETIYNLEFKEVVGLEDIISTDSLGNSTAASTTVNAIEPGA